MASSLKDWQDKEVCVVTADGRVIVGKLAGFDQVQNLILTDAHERVYSSDQPVERVPLGLYVIRGDNLCLIGELDPEKLQDDVFAEEPLKSVHHQTF